MADTGILTTIAGVSMTFVGFTGLLISLRGRSGKDEWDPFQRYQLTSVIASGLTALFASLGVIVVAGLIGPGPAFRVVGAVVAIGVAAFGQYAARRVRVVYPQQRFRDALPFSAAGIAAILVFAANVFVPDLALFQLGLLLLLAMPALVFRFVLTHLS